MRLPNHLLHELDLRAHSIPEICKKAGVWYPHIYACLRNEKEIGVSHLECLGEALGMELVWRKINSGE